MSDSKSGSKSDLNESNMPLLDDAEKGGDTPEKEQIEMKEEGEAEEGKDKGKKKKEKKKKEPKEKKPKGPGCIETLSAGLNMEARDEKAINTAINVDFDEVIAEPLAAQGFDPIWRLTYVLFSQTKLWLYRIFAAVLAVPAALVWALLFSLITVVYVWVLAPVLRLFDLFVAVARRVMVGVMHCTVDPVCTAVGGLFSRVNTGSHRHIVEEA